MTSRRSEDRLREDAQAIFRAALDAVEPTGLVAQALERQDLGLPPGGKVAVIGFGKAAIPMATGVDRVLGTRVARGVLVAPHGSTGLLPAAYRLMTAGHPNPDEGSVSGAMAVRDLARSSVSGDLLIALISGGASALLTLPPVEVPLQDVATVISRLSLGGAPIQHLNVVRKHLDGLKGGRLARESAPARVLALVLSDVPGDSLDVIASGPLTADPSSVADALAIVQTLGREAPRSVVDYLGRQIQSDMGESPDPADRCFGRVQQIVVGNGALAARAACDAAASLGYAVESASTEVDGDTIGVAQTLAAWTRQQLGQGPACRVSAGETTISVTGAGNGGRNQQLALEAAAPIAGLRSVLIGSLATDGVDGPTSAAGAMVTGSSFARAQAAGFDVPAYLDDNDANPVLAALGDLIVTGPTATNVADIQLALVG